MTDFPIIPSRLSRLELSELLPQFKTYMLHEVERLLASHLSKEHAARLDTFPTADQMVTALRWTDPSEGVLTPHHIGFALLAKKHSFLHQQIEAGLPVMVEIVHRLDLVTCVGQQCNRLLTMVDEINHKHEPDSSL